MFNFHIALVPEVSKLQYLFCRFCQSDRIYHLHEEVVVAQIAVGSAQHIPTLVQHLQAEAAEDSAVLDTAVLAVVDFAVAVGGEVEAALVVGIQPLGEGVLHLEEPIISIHSTKTAS